MSASSDPPSPEPAPEASPTPVPTPTSKPRPPVSGRKGGRWVRGLILMSGVLLVGGAVARMAIAPADPLNQARADLETRAEQEREAEVSKSANVRARGAYQRCSRLCVLDVWGPLERCMGAAKEDSPDLETARKGCWTKNKARIDPCLAACSTKSKEYAGVGMDPMVAEMLASVSRDDARRLTAVETKKKATKSAKIGGVMVTRGDAEMAPPTSLETLLPYLTEGSLFLLVGFGLGALTRLLLKGVLIVCVLFVAGMMFLESKEFVTVDWGPMLDWVRVSVLNLSANESISEFLATKVPSLGTLGIGYFIGLRRR